MSQKKVVFYNAEGRITGQRSGTVENVNASLASSTATYVDVTGLDPVNAETHYVSNGQVFAKGEQPSPGHVFNYGNAVWELDIPFARQNKWIDIKAARTAQEFGTFDWGGYTFQCDEVSQRRIQGAVQLSAIDDTLTLDWTLADNSVQTFTAADYIQIGQALAVHVSQCHERGRILRLEIEAATTLEDLEAIVW
jgi:hypothetical protein